MAIGSLWCPGCTLPRCDSDAFEEASARLPRGVEDMARSLGLEKAVQELFRLHDLNANGVLELDELVQLNARVAVLHGRASASDLADVRKKYQALFLEKLDPDGNPVPYSVFRRYVLRVLDGLDPDPPAQEMIVEQLGQEARSARAAIAQEAGLALSGAAAAPESGSACSCSPHKETLGLGGMACKSLEDCGTCCSERAPLIRCPSPAPPTPCVRPRVPPRGPPLAGTRVACGTALDCWGSGSVLASASTKGVLSLCGDGLPSSSKGAEPPAPVARREAALGGG